MEKLIKEKTNSLSHISILLEETQNDIQEIHEKRRSQSIIEEDNKVNMNTENGVAKRSINLLNK